MSKIKSNTKVHWSPMKMVMLIGLIAYTLCLFVPIIWGVFTSFKGQADFRINVIGLPKEWIWNYGTVYEEFKVPIFTEAGTSNISM